MFADALALALAVAAAAAFAAALAAVAAAMNLPLDGCAVLFRAVGSDPRAGGSFGGAPLPPSMLGRTGGPLRAERDT